MLDRSAGRHGRNRDTSKPKGRQLDDAALADVQRLLGSRERRRDLLIEFLHLIQDEFGCLQAKHILALAEELRLSQVEVYEVASFYSMLETTPVGRHNIAVCTNISCMLRGADEIVAHLEQRLGIRLGDSTADGKFYLKQEEECLAACCGAPMMMVDHVYHENLTTADVDEILDGLD